MESPSHLRDDHPEEIKLTLLAALLHCRQREITDTLVDLLIATVCKINTRAERRVVDEFVGDPDGVVRDVVFPAAGGVNTLMDLLAEYKTKGNTFRQHKQRVFKASYTNHYRAGLIELIDALEFRSHNTMHRPVLVAGVIPADLAELLHRTDKRGRQRVQRTVYECGVFQTLRERLRCKEIWVLGAEKWRNPNEDLPADFEAKRAENYAALHKPTNADAFVNEIREEMRAELGALQDALPRLDWLDIKAGRKQGAIVLTPYDAATEPRNLRRLKQAVRTRWGVLWGEGTTAVASDSTYFTAFAQNIFTEWHSRYRRGKRGVLIYIHFGKSGELAANRREEQELSMLCLQALQASLGFVNTLMLQDILAEPEWADVLGDADRRGLTPLFTSNKCVVRDGFALGGKEIRAARRAV